MSVNILLIKKDYALIITRPRFGINRKMLPPVNHHDVEESIDVTKMTGLSVPDVHGIIFY